MNKPIERQIEEEHLHAQDASNAPFGLIGDESTGPARNFATTLSTDRQCERVGTPVHTKSTLHSRSCSRPATVIKRLANVRPEVRANLERLGNERALIYKTLVLTGLRANERRTLECRDLSFGDVPFIRLRHANEKNRKGSTIPIRSDLAVELCGWIVGREFGERVFTVPTGLVRIMDRDLVAAGIPKIDADACVVHVHALQHSFGTRLSKAGVAQAAMRHSNIALTMGTDTDARLLDTAEAVEQLSVFRKQSSVAPTVAPATDKTCQFESKSDQIKETAKDGLNTKKPAKTQGFAGFKEWAMRDSNPRHSRCKRDALAN